MANGALFHASVWLFILKPPTIVVGCLSLSLWPLEATFHFHTHYGCLGPLHEAVVGGFAVTTTNGHKLMLQIEVVLPGSG